MTTADLIPVLKAIHHNPTCHEVMSDWFEERGDLSTALRLRDPKVCEMVRRWNPKVGPGTSNQLGYQIIRLIAHRGGLFRPNLAVREALTVEALGRIKITEANQDHTDRMTRDHMRYHMELGYEVALGHPPSPTRNWFRFKPHLGQSSVTLRHHPSLRSTVTDRLVPGAADEPVILSVVKHFGWEGVDLTHTLCGGWLTFTAHVLVGRSDILGVPVVSELTPAVLTNPSIMSL